MLDYYNKYVMINRPDGLIVDLFLDFYHYSWLSLPVDTRIDFIEWLCQENLIGQEITEELITVWKLHKE